MVLSLRSAMGLFSSTLHAEFKLPSLALSSHSSFLHSCILSDVVCFGTVFHRTSNFPSFQRSHLSSDHLVVLTWFFLDFPPLEGLHNSIFGMAKNLNQEILLLSK